VEANTKAPMLLIVHDFPGYAFPVQLSRELAGRGHTVMHWSCSSNTSGKGALTRRADDPPSLSLRGLPMKSPFERYSPWTRLRQEASYGWHVSRRIIRVHPDAVLLSNTPLAALLVIIRTCARHEIPTLFWQQDITSIAIGTAARDRLGVAGWPIAVAADYAERHAARSAQAVVPICEDFLATLERWGVRHRATVVPNWAPLPEIPVRPRENWWARHHGLVGRPVAMYSGTLGIKHDPSLLVTLAKAMRVATPEGRVVVLSEGRGRDWLARMRDKEALDNLVLLDYQPNEHFADVIASAEVLLAILEPTASRYSVPSKVLSYLCSERPVVAVIPHDNAAAEVVRKSGGGLVIEPGRPREFANVVLSLLGDRRWRETMGKAGRLYAEEAFDIKVIGDRFESMLVPSN
jgi:colanic acid biosynthesis glycosyl transferase WcaI